MMGNSNGFKQHMAFIVMYSAVGYAVLMALVLGFLMLYGVDVQKSAVVWTFFATQVGNLMGVLLSKLSTIIDYIYGASSAPPAPPSVTEAETPAQPTAMG